MHLRSASRALSVFTALFVISAWAAEVALARTGYPRVLNLFLSKDVDAQDIQDLARWDALVLDADFPYENPGVLDQIRVLNPDIKLFAYIPINGTDPNGNLRPPETVLHQYWAGITANDYWLYSVDGTPVSDWPGKWSTNLTPNSPLNAQGQTYAEWFAYFVYDAVWEQGASSWDGIYLDDVWDNISWINSTLESPVDSDRDGIGDNTATLDAWWRQGNQTCVELLRSLLGSNVPIIANGANTEYSMNGTMIENFPYNGPADQGNTYGYSWNKWMFTGTGAYFAGLDNYNDVPFTTMMINTNWPDGDRDNPVKTGRFEAHKRFCLGSTLLGDGFFSFDHAWDDHAAIWWEPEYDLYLGDATGPAYSYTVDGRTIWRRDFEEVTVVVNPNNLGVVAQSGLPNIDGWDAYIGPRIIDPPPPDTIPPAEITWYWGWANNDVSATLKFWSVGDDGMAGRADHYLTRYAVDDDIKTPAEWAAATPVPNPLIPKWPGIPETLVVNNLQPSTVYYFAVKAVDDAGNEGPVENYNFRITTLDPDPPGGDITPPSAITSLSVKSHTNNSVTFEWAAPGDDGNLGVSQVYHGRYGTVPITAGNWDASFMIPNLPTPAGVGTGEVSSLGGLNQGTTYYLALRAEDDNGNLAPMGNVPSFTTYAGSDFTPPPPVADLAVTASHDNSLELQFTAPADAEGTVTGYQLRYVEGTTFTEAQWSGAAGAGNVPVQAPGTTVTHEAAGLSQQTTYAFRMRSVDDASNYSDLSNVASGLTGPPPPADTTGPEPIADLLATGSTETAIGLQFTAPGDAEGDVDAYEIRYVEGPDFPESLWLTGSQVQMSFTWPPGSTVTASINGLEQGTDYSFRARSWDDSGNPSLIGNHAAGATQGGEPPPDTTGPATVVDLDTTAVGETTVNLAFTAPADAEGAVVVYDLRYLAGTSLSEAQWASATPVPTGAPGTPGATETATAASLTASTDYTFRLRSQDDSGNWSALGNARTVTTDTPPPPPDILGPTPVLDLAAASVGETSITLGFTAPADAEGTVVSYDLRYITGTGFTEVQWPGATPVPTGTPGSPGSGESAVASGLSPGTVYSFALQSFDDSGNPSVFSNVLVVSTAAVAADTTGPPAIADLIADQVGEVALRLRFTAPADAEGTVVAYDLRYAEAALLPESAWDDATPVATGSPSNPGALEAVLVGSLTPATTYSFRVRSRDDSGNWSALSNLLTQATAEPPPPDTTGPALVADLGVAAVSETTITLAFTAPADTEGWVESYDLRYVPGTGFTDAQWPGATPVDTGTPKSPGSPESVTVTGLTGGDTYSFTLLSQDDSGNPSAYSNVVTAGTTPPPPPDTTGPAEVTDLSVDDAGETWLDVSFTTPADAEGTVAELDLRYVQGTQIGPGLWASATPVPLGSPGAPGSPVAVRVSGLADDTDYAFLVRSTDGSGNPSALSNGATGHTEPAPPPPDTTPPLAVADLAVVSRGANWITLGFTAPSDPEGPLTAYDLRYVAGNSFPPGAFDGALQAPTPFPATAGETEHVTVTGLPSDASFSFRIKSRDGAGNWSGVSNRATGSTDPLPPDPDTVAPDAISDLVAVPDTGGVVHLFWTATGDDRPGPAALQEIRWRLDALDASTWGDAAVVPGVGTPADSGAAEAFTVTGLPVPATVAFAIVTEDTTGNRSDLSNVAVVDLEPFDPGDVSPPSAPSGVGGEATSTLVRVWWSGSPEPDLSHYRVYRSRLSSMVFTLYRDSITELYLLDTAVVPGRSYSYRVTAVDATGNESPPSETVVVEVPRDFTGEPPMQFFGAGYPTPNPSSGPVSVDVDLGTGSRVVVEVYTVTGRLVRRFEAGNVPAGVSRVSWDGVDAAGRRVGRGIYFMRLRTDLGERVRRVIIVR